MVNFVCCITAMLFFTFIGACVSMKVYGKNAALTDLLCGLFAISLCLQFLGSVGLFIETF